MNWLRAAILTLTVVAAQAAPGHKEGINTEEIASARDAVRQATATLGEDHPVTAILLRNLALAMQEAGYSNYAEHYGQQSLAILERRFGPHDVSLVPVLNVLAEVAVSQAEYDQAREYAQRAVAIGPAAEAHYGTALHNLAAVLQVQGDYADAASYYRQALEVRRRFLPAGHPYIALTRAALDRDQRLARRVRVAQTHSAAGN